MSDTRTTVMTVVADGAREDLNDAPYCFAAGATLREAVIRLLTQATRGPIDVQTMRITRLPHGRGGYYVSFGRQRPIEGWIVSTVQ